PVVINHGGWRADLIRETGSGLVLPYEDPEAAARRLIEAIRDKAWLAAAGRAAAQVARERFARDVLAGKLMGVLEGAAAKADVHHSGGCMDHGDPGGSTRRVLDIAGASLGLALTWPLMLSVAALILLCLGRPVLFRQERPGLHGRLFTLLKFRTMSEARDGSGHLLPDAHRMTRLGRFLRATSLDELPELVNVLRGEMGLVGPRPLLPEYLPLYNPRQARRHEVKPGLTGWAQIHGRNALGWPERLEMDVWYVENRSVRLDLKILLATPAAVLRRQGIGHREEPTMPSFTGEPAVSRQERV
ncbi:MAG: sugar transferase, partial [Anaerolineae bacterium]